MIRSPYVESNMAIRANPTQEESYASLVSYLLFIIGTPVINGEYGITLLSFKTALGLPVAEAQVHLTIREYL